MSLNNNNSKTNNNEGKLPSTSKADSLKSPVYESYATKSFSDIYSDDNNSNFIGSKLNFGEVICKRCQNPWCITYSCRKIQYFDFCPDVSNTELTDKSTQGIDQPIFSDKDFPALIPYSESYSKNKSKKHSYKSAVNNRLVKTPDFKSNPLIPQPLKKIDIYDRCDCNLRFYIDGTYRTIVGGLDIVRHSNLLEVLMHDKCFDTRPEFKCSVRDIPSVVNYIRSFVKNSRNYSKVGSLKGNPSKVNLKVRNSLNIDIYEDTIKKLSDILVPAIKNCMTWDSDVEVHPSHANIILYNKGGKFDVHKDKILELPEKLKKMNKKGRCSYQMYSMVYCLGSNLKDRIRSNEGNTVVYTSIQELIETASRRTIWDTSLKLAPHIYNESVIPGEFVLFPSNLFHSSLDIYTKGKYKLVLKMDFWISIGKYPLSVTDDFLFSSPLLTRNFKSSLEKTSNNVHCNCKLCDPYRQRIPTYRYYLLRLLANKNTEVYFDENILNYIISFFDTDDLMSMKNIFTGYATSKVKRKNNKDKKGVKKSQFYHDLRVQRMGYLPPFQYIDKERWHSRMVLEDSSNDEDDYDDCNGDY